jgi:hypothetical protein
MAENSRFNLRQSIIESLFRNVGMQYRHSIGIFLGATAALLGLTSGILTPRTVAWVFLAALLLTAASLILFRANALDDLTKKPDQFAWGLLVTIILGFGLGGLIFQTRSWWFWLWRQYLRINEAHELVLEFLFIFGVILGVFVVRNWGKEQKAFTESLTGILGGTFIAAIFGESLKEQGLTPMRALTYYGLGFVISAAINLLVAGWLTAKYTNDRSKSSRAMLDFLYGSERAKAVDGYFLQNFKEDPDYARKLLIDALLQYRTFVGQEFARRMDRRRLERVAKQQENNNLTVGDHDAKCRDFWEKQKQEISLRNKIARAKAKSAPADYDELETLQQEIEQLKRDFGPPSHYYQLIAICCDPKDRAPEGPGYKVVNPADQDYDVIYKELMSPAANNSEGHETSDDPAEEPHESGSVGKRKSVRKEPNFTITSEMFRVGVLRREKDDLAYLVAPGQYRAPFRYFGSVAGLALMVRQTIIMNRDRTKRFRARDYRDGVCPRDIEQWRGLDEIDYLSYVSIPVATQLGTPKEAGLGVINIDTRLFVTHCKLEGVPVNAKEGVYRTRLTPGQLTESAVNLYEENDQDVEYLERLTETIVPVMELYSRCEV